MSKLISKATMAIIAIVLMAGCATRPMAPPTEPAAPAPIPELQVSKFGLIDFRPIIGQYGRTGTVDFGPAYMPHLKPQQYPRMDGEYLKSYSLEVRDMLPAFLPLVYRAVDRVRSMCRYGAGEMRLTEEIRDNPAVSSYYRPPHALSAMIYHMSEKPKLADIRLSFDCKTIPEPRFHRQDFHDEAPGEDPESPLDA